MSFAKQSLKMSFDVLEFPQNFTIQNLILRWPCTLFGSRVKIIFIMSVFDNFMFDKLLSIKKSSLCGNLLSFYIKKHRFVKKELKSSTVSLKSVAKLFSWNNGGISGIFL